MADDDDDVFPPEPVTDPGHVLSEADWAALVRLRAEIAANLGEGD